MLWLFFDLLAHSTVILGVAELVCCIPGLSAATRHRLRLFGFALLLCWPLLALVIPDIRMPWFDDRAASASVAIDAVVRQQQNVTSRSSAMRWLPIVWAGGSCAWILYYLVGCVVVGRLRRRAIVLNGLEWSGLLANVSLEMGGSKNRTQLLESQRITTPFVFGWRQKAILLPLGCRDWPARVRRSVLAHEVAHIKRRDLSAQSFAQIVTALWWFQPLAWLMLKRLRADSEFACDELVLRSGVAPSDYAGDLLCIASQFRDCGPIAASMIPMASTHLAARVGAILATPVRRTSAGLYAVCACAIAGTAIAASALSVNQSHNVKLSGGNMIRRIVPAGLLVSTGLSAASISGTLYSQSGNTIAEATATLVNADTQFRQQARSDSEGRFTFTTLPAGQYILCVDKPGFASLFREFALADGTSIQKGLTLHPGEQTVAKAVSPQPGSPGVLHINAARQLVNLVKQVQPVYPPGAKAAGLQGKVQLEAVISKEGVPLDIRVVSSPSDELTQASLEAVRQWRYRPTLLNGQPVEISTEVTVSYALAP